MVVCNSVAYGATCTTTSTTTWSCGTPGQNDDLIVNHSITITGNFIVNNGSITVNAPHTLTINGNLTFNNNSTVLVNNGATIHVMGNFLNKNNSGDVEIFGNLIIDGNFENGEGAGTGAVIDIGGTGSITYGGTCSNAGTVEDDDGSYSDDCNNPVLPVELINLRAVAAELGNLIQWETASERNNDFFNVERSTNSRDWETIARIEGSGDSDQVVNYQFLDDKPLPGRVFYRLKQVDFDGAFEYSYIISVTTGAIPQFHVLSIYPNPTSDNIKLLYVSDNEDPVWYQILDPLGRQINSGLIDNHFGSSLISMELPDKDGIYLVLMKNREKLVSRRIIKTR